MCDGYAAIYAFQNGAWARGNPLFFNVFACQSLRASTLKPWPLCSLVSCPVRFHPIAWGGYFGGYEMRATNRLSTSYMKTAPDGDAQGGAAAQALAERAHSLGWDVSIRDPGTGRDFNDILLERVTA